MIAAAGFAGSRMGRNGYSAEDVDHDIPGIHIEVKRAERVTLPAWLEQAERDAAPGHTPVVVYRQSRQSWRAVVPFEWLLKVLAAAQRHDTTLTDIAASDADVSVTAP